MRAVGWGLIALAVWAPFPLGSNRPIFWVTNACAAIIVAGWFLIAAGTSRTRVELPAGAGWLLLAAMTLPVWMAVQALIPAGSLASSLFARFAPGLPSSAGVVSASPSASLATVVQVTSPILLAGMSAAVGLDARYRHRLLCAIVIMTTVTGLLGFLALSFGFEQVLGGSEAYEGFLTGPQVNRNAAAILLGFGLVCAFALLPSRLASTKPDGRNRRPAFLVLSATVIRGAPVFLAIAINAAALLQTGSRAGTAIVLVALLFVAFLLFRSGGRRAATGRSALIVAAILVVVAALGSASFVLDRISVSELSAEARPWLFRDTLAMIWDHPLLGQGAGSFADVFPVFNSGHVPPFLAWNRAHSTYLQAAAELGIPALCLVVGILLFSLVILLRAAFRRRESAPTAIAAFGVLVIVALHSLIDFSLQIQAIGIVFAILAGAGYAEAQSSSAVEVEPRRRPRDPGDQVAARQSAYVEVPLHTSKAE